ncbi:unknown [Clostridium sp. CAG:567]|nr:unknown [Clostridium sp. CAG:567]
MATQKEKNNEEEVKNKKSTKKKKKEVSESSKSAPKAETAKKTSTTTKKKSTTKSSAKKAPPEKNKKSTTKKEKPSTQKNKEKIKEEIVEEPIEENKKSIEKIDIKKIQETLKKEITAKKVIPKEEQDKMNVEVFKNIAIAIVMVVFLNFIILGFINIENSVFLVDLKVFAVSILAIAIGVFEYAYKKDSGKIAIYGIETLILAFAMLAFIYLDIMCHSNFVIITVLITYTIAIYYTVKSIIIYQKMKKQYYINSMKEIIKK